MLLILCYFQKEPILIGFLSRHRFIGNGEVDSSILSRSTILHNKINVLAKYTIPQSSILSHYATLALAAQSPHTVKQQQSCGEWLLAENDTQTQIKNSKAKAGDVEKFRTTPISSTIVRVKQLPTSAILYKCLASKYWQFRVFLEGAQRKRSTKTEDAVEAQRLAKLIYAEMLQNIHGSEQGKRKLSSKRTLHTVASSLWEKQAVMVAQGELNPQKNRIDKYVYCLLYTSPSPRDS